MLRAEVWQRDTSGSVCMNTEEMMAEIARVNNEGVPDDIVIGSTDVKALYPSLDIEFTIEKVCKVFEESDVQVSEIDSDELGTLLSTNA